MEAGRAGLLFLVLALPAAVSADSEPRLPKLEAESPPPPAAPDAAGARGVPRTVSICQDRGTRRCWVVTADHECPGALTGGVFRAVPAGGEADEALARCLAQFDEHN